MKIEHPGGRQNSCQLLDCWWTTHFWRGFLQVSHSPQTPQGTLPALPCPSPPQQFQGYKTRILCLSQIPISSCCRLFLSVIKISHYFSIWVYGTLHKSIMPCRTAQSNNETQGMEANFALLHHCYGGWYQTPTSHRAMCLWSPLTFLMCFPNCHFQKVTKVTRITLMLF